VLARSEAVLVAAKSAMRESLPDVRLHQDGLGCMIEQRPQISTSSFRNPAQD
jgi:hypothetical protein